jgi:hypothetical protein
VRQSRRTQFASFFTHFESGASQKEVSAAEKRNEKFLRRRAVRERVARERIINKVAHVGIAESNQ